MGAVDALRLASISIHLERNHQINLIFKVVKNDRNFLVALQDRLNGFRTELIRRDTAQRT
jgi:hypothetical protein